MRIQKRKTEAVAIVVNDGERRRVHHSIIVTANTSQASALCAALLQVDGVDATECVREFDVFGKMFFIPNRMPDYDET